MSTQDAGLYARLFCDARSRYLSAVADLEAGPDHDLSLAQIVSAAKHGLEYDLASQAQATAYLNMLASVDGAPSDTSMSCCKRCASSSYRAGHGLSSPLSRQRSMS
jgi:hypothetical protein